MPRVIGGQCYGSVPDPTACRAVQVLYKSGDWVYAGGSIDKVADSTGKNVTSGLSNLFRFNATTHAIDPTFRPQFFRTPGVVYNAPVQGIVASPDGQSLYVVGQFTTVASAPGGTALVRKGIAKISATTGAVDPGFNAKLCFSGGGCNGYDVAMVNDSLWVAGDFSKVGTTAVGGLASVDLSTGALTGAQGLAVGGHVVATAGTKVTRIKPSPLGDQVLLTGNFTSVGGKSRDAVAIVDIDAATGDTTGVDTWNSPNLAVERERVQEDAPLDPERGLGPDDSFFVLVASGAGGGHPTRLCATRWPSSSNNGNANSIPAATTTPRSTRSRMCAGRSVGVRRWPLQEPEPRGPDQRQDRQAAGRPGQRAHYGLGVIDVIQRQDACGPGLERHRPDRPGTRVGRDPVRARAGLLRRRRVLRQRPPS